MCNYGLQCADRQKCGDLQLKIYMAALLISSCGLFTSTVRSWCEERANYY